MRKAARANRFRVEMDGHAVVSLRCAGDRFDTEYVMEGGRLGEVAVRWRKGRGTWRVAGTGEGDSSTNDTNDMNWEKREPGVPVRSWFEMGRQEMVWRVEVENRTGGAVEVGDVKLPLPMNTKYVRDTKTTYTGRLIKHSLISGDGSFVYWMRCNGVGPYLLMTPLTGTHLEYFDVRDRGGPWEGLYSVYVHSAATGRATPGTWRQEHTSVTLAAGEKRRYGFRFQWAKDYQGVRDGLVAAGLVDVRVAPGMTVPADLEAMLALRVKGPRPLVTAEFPRATKIEPAGRGGTGAWLYRVRFTRLGENALTVRWGGGGGRKMKLECYATEPLETVIRKRSAFVAGRQQHRDASQWYDGLFSVWDTRSRALRGPDDTGGLEAYVVACDDPALCKAPMLAEKNVHYPQPREVAALERYIERFVWGGLQRRDDERPRAYGVYGAPNWKHNRQSEYPDDRGQLRMWRTFDYPHVVILYFNMYRIARRNPGLTRYLDAGGYLLRAYETARAYFTVPIGIRMTHFDFAGWCDWAYKLGAMNECVLVELIAALEAEGLTGRARWLRGRWERKVKYFLYDHPYPYGSEMFFDSTAFESTHAIARYALEHPLQADERLWYDRNLGRWYSHPRVGARDARAFLHRQAAANVACRGWLETAYYLLGSDYRQCGSSDYTLSYMSQMGGAALLDYALHYAAAPADALQLGYASLLSSWALVSRAPGNDGAAGWAFKAEKFGGTWCGQTHARGPWPYDGEIDLGFGAAIREAACVVFDDPVFGLTAYGGTLETLPDRLDVVPRDGVRRRLSVLLGRRRVHVELARDGFAAERPVSVRRDLGGLSFLVEDRGGGAHETAISFTGLRGGRYRVLVEGECVAVLVARKGQPLRAVVSMPDGTSARHVEVRPIGRGLLASKRLSI